MITFSEMGFRVKWARKQKGLTIRDVEAKSGVSCATLSRLENGAVGETSFAGVLKVCEVVGISIEDLIA